MVTYDDADDDVGVMAAMFMYQRVIYLRCLATSQRHQLFVANLGTLAAPGVRKRSNGPNVR